MILCGFIFERKDESIQRLENLPVTIVEQLATPTAQEQSSLFRQLSIHRGPRRHHSVICSAMLLLSVWVWAHEPAGTGHLQAFCRTLSPSLEEEKSTAFCLRGVGVARTATMKRERFYTTSLFRSPPPPLSS